MISNFLLLIHVNLDPEMAINCCPPYRLGSIILIILIDLDKKVVQFTFNHFVKSKWVWLSLLPSIQVDGKDHEDRRSQQNGRNIVEYHALVHR